MKEIKLDNLFKVFIFFLIIINLSQVVISQTDTDLLSKNLDLDFTHALSLINGNIFIIHKNGVIVYNYNFTIILYNYDLGGIPLISSEADNNLTSLIQCDDDNNQYVLALINDKIYIFSSRGQYIFHISNTSLFSDFSTDFFYQYYSFLYYKYDGSVYYFIVSFINNQNLIELIEFQININNKSFNLYNKGIFNMSNIISDSVTCQIINTNKYLNTLSCFYIKRETLNQFMLLLLDIENNFEIMNETKIFERNEIESNYIIKSSIGKEKNKILLEYTYPELSTMYIFTFDFDLYQSSNLMPLMNCMERSNLNNIQYFNYIDHFVCSCKNVNGVSLIKITNISISNFLHRAQSVDTSNCTVFINFDVIFLLYKGEYNLITNFLCTASTTQVFNFPVYLHIDNYEFPSDEPDSSYFFSNYTTIQQIKTTIPTTINQIKTTIPTTIIQIKTSTPSTAFKQMKTTTFKESTPISEVNCKLKCLSCNTESSLLNLCIRCNTNKDYYPSIVTGENYVECYNQQTKPANYFFNEITKYYEPCYSKCKSCKYQGNEEVNNCTLCKSNYIFRPDLINSSNCVIKCNYYYYIIFDEYFCTENNQCPFEVSLLIRNKGRCIDNCKDDNEYKYQFNYECFKECPEDTIPDENNICKLKDKKKCYLYSDSFLNVYYNDLESNNFNAFIKRYIIGFEDTDFHVDFYQSQNYTITIYKEMYCLKELEMNTTIIDFGECYDKIQKNYNLEGKNLIILISDFFKDKKLISTLFYFFHPETGEKLSMDEICNEEKFVIEKSLNYYPEINISQAKFFGDQNIDIFNSSDVFYNDLCFFFESPNGKDVPLKERLLIFYPNITLCDDSCNNAGVNLTSNKAICECKLKELLYEAQDATKLVGLDFANLIDSLSLDVVKCYKTLFQIKYLAQCYGGFISIILIIAQTICVIIAGKISMYKIRKTTFTLVSNYSSLLHSQKSLKYPPKKNPKTSKQLITINFGSKSKSDIKYRNSQNSSKSTSKSQKKLLFDNKTISLFKINNKKSTKSVLGLKEKKKLNTSILPLNNEINVKEYLTTSMNDLDYDELIIRENRSFWRMFVDKLILNQKLVDLFANNNWIIPKSIKVIFLIVMIDLYFVVNALFYNEEYIRDLYYSDEEETFFSFVPRSLNRIIYTTLSSSVLDFIISLLFPTENKIKKILIRKKDNIKEMKNKVFISMKNIINNYWIFIIISYIIAIFSWYYISCFNNVYPYLKIEWIKSSIFIFIDVQIIIFLGCFLFALLRFISIKSKNERLFRISNYFFS